MCDTGGLASQDPRYAGEEVESLGPSSPRLTARIWGYTRVEKTCRTGVQERERDPYT